MRSGISRSRGIMKRRSRGMMHLLSTARCTSGRPGVVAPGRAVTQAMTSVARGGTSNCCGTPRKSNGDAGSWTMGARTVMRDSVQKESWITRVAPDISVVALSNSSVTMSGCEQQLLPSRVNTAPHRETTITHQLNKKSQAPNKAIMTPPPTATTHRQHNKQHFAPCRSEHDRPFCTGCAKLVGQEHACR